MGQRRKARELAAQALYALDFAVIDPEFSEYEMLNQYPDILRELGEVLNGDNSAPVLDFADDLIKNVIINQNDINSEIEKHSQNWSSAQIACLDRNVLRVAVYELVYTDTPPAVVINEAIEISKKYCSESSGRFINGILDAVHKELQDRERIAGGKD